LWTLSAGAALCHAQEDSTAPSADASSEEHAGEGVSFRTTNVIPNVRVHPEYPRKMQELGKEGWSQMCLCIEPDGHVANPRVIDHSGAGEFDEAALSAVRKWKYSPQLVNGEPTERCEVAVVLRFSLSDKDGATRSFAVDINRIRPLIQSGKLDEAEEILKGLEPSNGYEMGRASFARAALAYARHDLRAEATALEDILRNPSVEDALKTNVLRSAFDAHVELSQISAALDDFAELKKREGDKLSEPVRAAGAQLLAAVASDVPLATSAVLSKRYAPCANDAAWTAKLLRRTFALEHATEDLDRVVIACEGHGYEGKFAPDREWRIPADWGACRLTVFGAEGATFTLMEYSEGSQATSAPLP